MIGGRPVELERDERETDTTRALRKDRGVLGGREMCSTVAQRKELEAALSS